MTPEEFKSLKPGDIIRHKGNGSGYTVSHNDYKGPLTGSVIAVRVMEASNPTEWELGATAERVFEQGGLSESDDIRLALQGTMEDGSLTDRERRLAARALAEIRRLTEVK